MTHRLATIHNVTDGQTQHCSISTTVSTVGKKTTKYSSDQCIPNIQKLHGNLQSVVSF